MHWLGTLLTSLGTLLTTAGWHPVNMGKWILSTMLRASNLSLMIQEPNYVIHIQFHEYVVG